MARVKIKHPDLNNEHKIQLLRTLSEDFIFATKTIPVQDGFVVLTRTDDDADYIFRPKIFDNLKSLHFNHVLPPELRAKRTAVHEKDIEEELKSESMRITEGIDNIFKIPR